MVADTVAHIIGVLLISGAIILVGAIVLFPQGISINTPTQLADLLTPSMGRAAKYIMGCRPIGGGFLISTGEYSAWGCAAQFRLQ